MQTVTHSPFFTSILVCIICKDLDVFSVTGHALFTQDGYWSCFRIRVGKAGWCSSWCDPELGGKLREDEDEAHATRRDDWIVWEAEGAGGRGL
jgi:hypothetical protein